jgi:predicted GNAT family acetyltransferase
MRIRAHVFSPPLKINAGGFMIERMSDNRSKPASRSVSQSRFEYEEAGQVAYLEFETDSSGWMTLLHTEVPRALQGRGIAGTLVGTAFEYAREHGLKVDIICPVAAHYVGKHPEFRALLGR